MLYLGMEFFKIKYSTNLKEIGPDYPQAGPWKGYDFKSPRAYINVHHNEFPDFVPDLNYFEISELAPLTDFVSSGLSHGFLLNDKAKSLLEAYNLPEHRSYPLVIKRGKDFIKETYFWMHIVSNYSRFIDFRKTKFYVSFFDKKETDLDISTYEELIDMVKTYINQNRFIKAQTIYLKPEFYELKMDLFIISTIDYNKYVSEKLRDRLIEDRITGLEIISVKQFLVPAKPTLFR